MKYHRCSSNRVGYVASLQQRKGGSQRAGFTLIEVLLVIAILAILASITIIAINPAKQLAAARDTERWSAVYSILNALHQYALDHDGTFPGDITEEERTICRTGSEDCTGLYDLSELTADQRYLVSIPVDPICSVPSSTCDDNNAMYSVRLNENGRIIVNASDSELEDISVTR